MKIKPPLIKPRTSPTVQSSAELDGVTRDWLIGLGELLEMIATTDSMMGSMGFTSVKRRDVSDVALRSSACGKAVDALEAFVCSIAFGQVFPEAGSSAYFRAELLPQHLQHFFVLLQARRHCSPVAPVLLDLSFPVFEPDGSNGLSLTLVSLLD